MANLRIVTRNENPERTTDRAALVIVARHSAAFLAIERQNSARAENLSGTDVNAVSEEMRRVFQRFYSGADYPDYPWR